MASTNQADYYDRTRRSPSSFSKVGGKISLAPASSSFSKVGGVINPVPPANPIYHAPAAPVAQNIVPQQQQQQTFISDPNLNAGAGMGGTGGGNAGATGGVNTDPPRPVMPNFDKWSDTQIEAGDSAFMDQRRMYQNKLQKYIADYENQVGNNAYGQKFDGDFLSQWAKGGGGGRMGADYRMADQGVGRNREMGLTNVAEDFASRGMANSGLYADSFQKAIEGYNRQKQGLDSATTGQIQDLSFKRGNFEGDTQAAIQAARRDAIGRLMQNFNLTGGA